MTVPESRYPGPGHDRMSHEVYSFTDMLEESLGRPVQLKSDFERIMICGMGGSAIGGDIIRDCVIGEAAFPVTVQRFPELPNWVNEKTFIIISSYSGNTKETLEMYDQAKAKGCKILVMSSGGTLMENALKNGDEIVKISMGFQPRSALGLMLGHLANAMDSLCGTNSSEEIRGLLPRLIQFRETLSRKGSEAEEIAKSIGSRIPVIYATSGIYASAIRWKSQINENSKIMAFAGSVPEFNHNEISGWSEGDLRGRCAPVFLYEVGAPANITELADKSIAALRDNNQEVLVVPIHGKTSLERTLYAVMLGDYVSLYLAYLKGADPMSIDAINRFKNRLAGSN